METETAEIALDLGLDATPRQRVERAIDEVEWLGAESARAGT